MPAVYSETQVTEYIQRFFERFRAIEAQLALISDRLGIPYETPGASLPQEVAELVRAGKRTEAVLRYRQLTKASLQEATDAIARL
jgi:hypothetical protein